MKRIIFSLLLTTLTILSFAQGWQKSYPDANCNWDQCYTEIVDIDVTQDGGYISLEKIIRDTLIIDFDTTTITVRLISVLKTDVDGVEQWRKEYSYPYDMIGAGIQATPDGGYIITGTEDALYPDAKNSFGLKINKTGNVLWKKSFPDGLYDPKVKVTNNGDYIFSRNGDYSFGGWSLLDGHLTKIDNQGNEVWSRTINGENIYNFLLLPNDDILTLSANQVTSGFNPPFILTKLDSNANVISKKTLINAPNANISSAWLQEIRFSTTPTGELLFLTSHYSRFRLIKLDPNGNFIWTKSSNLNFSENAIGLSFDANGNYVLTGNRIISNNWFPRITTIDTSGNIIWEKNFSNTNQFAISNNHIKDHQNYNVAVGTQNNQSSIWKMNAEGNLFSNLISGQVYHDTNNDCLQDTSELLLNNFLVEVKQGTNSYYALTNANGFYRMDLDSGSYTITIHHPSNNWTPCANNQAFTFSTFDTLIVGFPMQTAFLCPQLEVDISTQSLRQCCVNTYTVNYSNNGTQAAQNAYIEVNLDNHLIAQVDTSNPAISYFPSQNNLYRHQLDSVAINTSGQFTIDVVFDSTTVTPLGIAHCTEAHIFPDTICTPPTQWNGADITVSGYCNTDSIYFLIKNVGSVNMFQPLNYFVVEDDLIMLQVPYQLNQLDSIWVVLPTTNSTYRLIAEQAPNHPHSTFVTAAVENCNNSPNSTIGFINQFGYNNSSPFVSLDCTENIGSYDPNDKKGTPTGWNAEHYILPNTTIDYRIRFQNTGTDTAFNIVIRDTIDTDFLDITNIQFGASSHTYQAQILENGILKLTFANIMLPDSNVNEATSHGFLTYSIPQKVNNPIGSVIENTAAIYFDYNAPIITNTTFHTVGQLPAMVHTNTIKTPENISVNVFPNPFFQQTTFYIDDEQPRDIDFKVFDALGQLVHASSHSQTYQFEFHRNQMTSGIYFYSIQENGKILNQGKIIIQ